MPLLPTLPRFLPKRAMTLGDARTRTSGAHRHLHYEPLEDRLLFTVDPVFNAGLLPVASDALTSTALLVDEGLHTAPEQAPAPVSTFASAEELEQYLIDVALERYSRSFGREYHYNCYWVENGFYKSEPAIALLSADVQAANSHSGTNTQVAGVDEGDLVETDGDFLYVLSGDELAIFDAWPVEDLRLASRVKIGGSPFAQYLNGDRLTILSYRGAHASWHCSWKTGVTVTVLDVSDRESPKLVQETDLDGRFIDSRAVGDYVYLILHNDLRPPFPEPLPIPVQTHETGSDEGATRFVYETRDQYTERMRGQMLDCVLPGFSSYGPDGKLAESGLVSEVTDIYRPDLVGMENLLSVVVFDVTSDEAGLVSSTAVPTGYATEVYMSNESLYVLESRCDETLIVRLDIDASSGKVQWSATGTVPGRLLNQFCVDQYGGYLRVATTRGWAQNNVYVLKQNGVVLEIVGRLENLAPGEQIYSARFMGDRAFVVTFRKVDPLFTIDLSDPIQPRVVGALKIPGFSNYLHGIDDDYLIGLGRNADVNTGLFQDPQVSLFNVADLGDPGLLDRFTIETGRTGGMNVFDDHHAIAYFPEHQVLAVSVPDVDTWRFGTFWNMREACASSTENDLWVFRIDVPAPTEPDNQNAGIQLLGRIEHGRSAVSRGIRIDEYLYAISNDRITVHEILNPEVQLAELHFGPGHSDPTNVYAMPRDLEPGSQVIQPYTEAVPAPQDTIGPFGIEPWMTGAEFGHNVAWAITQPPAFQAAHSSDRHRAATNYWVDSTQHNASMGGMMSEPTPDRLFGLDRGPERWDSDRLTSLSIELEATLSDFVPALVMTQ